MNMEQWLNDVEQGRTKESERKPCSRATFPPQISHEVGGIEAGPPQ
jgi:hypothetical protein